ncbi:MAG: sigma-54-dependent Fis family transcriptional regulator [Deltaproteobacteria bacterium]|nr:MAG: sigma-54-dependent Fis family transcriptional regulator [Deltaproteobacteria bacterium]
MLGRILIVDDDQNMCEMLENHLKSQGFDPSWHTTAEEAFSQLKHGKIDVVLTDLQMSGMDGIDLCDRVVKNRPDIPVVVMTAFGSMETAVTALRAGAYDFITKPFELNMLTFTLKRALNHRSLQEKVKKLSKLVEQSKQFDKLLGESPPMQKIFDLIARVADSEASVLVMGESGTGKELVARALHQKSSRQAAPFVTVNCAALPEKLLESELFGHTKGAFTDAKSDRKGLFLQADGGTLFLDEMGALPLILQPKLLRALEEHYVRPVGSDKEIPFNVRLITGTNTDLESAIEEGQFREDLFFRINIIQLTMPPLRSRGSDILLLAQYFLEQFAVQSGKHVAEISKSVAEKLLSYHWPGNVRELRNAIEHASVLARYEQITVEDLPGKIQTYRNSHIIVDNDNPSELLSLEEVERRYILHVLKTVAENRTLAAQILRLDRKTLYRKLRHYGEKKSE